MFLHTGKLTIEGRELELRSVLNPSGIDFDFTFERVKFSLFANANVTIYNINDDTFEALTRKSDRSNFQNVSRIKCEAGYDNKNDLIFEGTAYRVDTTFSRGEKATLITCSTTVEKLLKAEVSLQYRKAPRLSQAFGDLARKIGLSLDTSRLAPADDKKIAQTSFYGTVSKFLSNEASANGQINANFDGSTVFLFSLSASDAGLQANRLFIDKSTGMILSPTITSTNLVKVDSLFNPKMRVGVGIDIVTERVITTRTQQGLVIVDTTDGLKETVIVGEIYKVNHDFKQAGATTTIEVLPAGQKVARSNLGIGV